MVFSLYEVKLIVEATSKKDVLIYLSEGNYQKVVSITKEGKENEKK